jgi:TPR repeat protein
MLIFEFSWWLLAAQDDTHEPVVEAQTALAFFYSQKNSNFYNLTKALYWHNKASKHGSLESLGKKMID